MKSKAIVLGALASATAPACACALAQKLRCTGIVGAVSPDNVLVPERSARGLDRTRTNGSAAIERRRIKGNMLCKEDTPAPTGSAKVSAGPMGAAVSR